jgi:hypothetical protein
MERDILRARARRRLGPLAAAGARIALALFEVEAGMRSPLQLEGAATPDLQGPAEVAIRRYCPTAPGRGRCFATALVQAGARFQQQVRSDIWCISRLCRGPAPTCDLPPFTLASIGWMARDLTTATTARLATLGLSRHRGPRLQQAATFSRS